MRPFASKKIFLLAMGITTSGKQGKISKSKFWANDDDAIVEPGVDQINTARLDDATNDSIKSSKSDDNSDSNAGSSSSLDLKSDDDVTNDVVAKKGEKERISSDLDF